MENIIDLTENDRKFLSDLKHRIIEESIKEEKTVVAKLYIMYGIISKRNLLNSCPDPKCQTCNWNGNNIPKLQWFELMTKELVNLFLSSKEYVDDIKGNNYHIIVGTLNDKKWSVKLSMKQECQKCANPDIN